jgi:hypothetical protein
MALDDQLASLVVSAYALDDDRVLSLDGVTLQPTVDRLDPRIEVRQQVLPDDDVWAAATDRAPRILGVTASPLRSAANVATLARDVRAAAEPHRDAVRLLVPELSRFADHVGVPPDAPRRRTAHVAQTLVDGIATARDDGDVIRFLATVDVPTTAEALGASIKQADHVVRALEQANVELLDVAFALDEPWGADAAVIRDRLVDAVTVDQFTSDLVSVLDSVTRDATGLVGRATQSPSPARPEAPPPVATTPPLSQPGAIPRSGQRQNLSGDEAQQVLEDLLAAGRLRSLDVRWELEP